MDKPKGAQYCVELVWYKVCERWGYVWYHVNGHWQRSAKTEAELTVVKKEPTSGQRTGKGVDPNTNQKLVLDTIKDYGSIDKDDIASLTSMSAVSVKNALKGLVGHGDITLNRKTNLYGLTTDSQLELSWRATA